MMLMTKGFTKNGHDNMTNRWSLRTEGSSFNSTSSLKDGFRYHVRALKDVWLLQQLVMFFRLKDFHTIFLAGF